MIDHGDLDGTKDQWTNELLMLYSKLEALCNRDGSPLGIQTTLAIGPPIAYLIAIADLNTTDC